MDPSPPYVTSAELAEAKAQLRRRYRALRREHVAALPSGTRALLFMRPPASVARLIPESACVGLYHPLANEAPTQSYARWLHENGRTLALPWFADREASMAFRTWADPYGNELAPGPFGMLQPSAQAPLVDPDALFVPLVAFTASGGRLGQGGGHYDRWLGAHRPALAIGLAWDSQLAESLPAEPHDRHLDAVVTPTRLYERES